MPPTKEADMMDLKGKTGKERRGEGKKLMNLDCNTTMMMLETFNSIFLIPSLADLMGEQRID